MAEVGIVGRPIMPAGYGISAESDGRLDWAWLDSRLETARNYWVASTRPDGRPHVMPVWGVLDRFVQRYADKYGITVDPGEAFGSYSVRPSVALAWREQDFPASATRWRLAEG